MVFQWFPMVANHWSDDGMVTIHRSGLVLMPRRALPPSTSIIFFAFFVYFAFIPECPHWIEWVENEVYMVMIDLLHIEEVMNLNC